MYYTPQHMIDAYSNAVTAICIIAAIAILFIVFAFSMAIFPEQMKTFFKKIKRFFGIDKVVRTVYTDKSKNYSQTEFLPVPVKAPTESFSYEFLGWNKFARDKKGNFVTEPIFLKKVKTCIVNVYDEKNNVLETHEVEYGAGITIAHKKIIKQPTKEFEFEFIGWDKETKAFFENTEIRPMFKAKPIKYNYKFVLDDEKTVVFEKTSISGTPITVPNDPIKIDEEYVYEFVGWKNYKRGMLLDKDYVFVAMFERLKAKTQEEKLSKQKSAIASAVNEYKPKKKKSTDKSHDLIDNQRFGTKNKIQVEKNIKNDNTKPKKENSDKSKKEKSLLNGVIVEKNKTNKNKV